MSILNKFIGYFRKSESTASKMIVDLHLPNDTEGIDEENRLQKQGEGSDVEEEYEIVEREFLPAKIVCPDCGGITLEGFDFCDKCGGEI